MADDGDDTRERMPEKLLWYLANAFLAMIVLGIGFGISLFFWSDSLPATAWDAVSEYLTARDTVYAPRYNKAGFEMIEAGTPIGRAVELIGEPLLKHEIAIERRYIFPEGVMFDVAEAGGRIIGVHGADLTGWTDKSIREAYAVYGTSERIEPLRTGEVYHYSLHRNGLGGGHYHERWLTVDTESGTVTGRRSGFYVD